MMKHALFVRLEAKPGKEKEFALQLGPSTFGIFDAFADEAGRQAHLNGPIAQALGANAPKLLAQAPSIERIDVLGTKLPG
jgi:quinol monooxygenase YgiN